MRAQYRGRPSAWITHVLAGLLLLALAAPGCATRRLQRALDSRLDALYAEPGDPPSPDRFPIGASLRIEAAAELVRRRVLRTIEERELAEIVVAGGAETGAPSLVFVPDWPELVVELRRAPERGDASVDLLVSVPGTASAEAGPLAMAQPVRVAALLPIELGARVLEKGGVELLAMVAQPDGVRVSVQLPAFPPGSGALISGAAQGALREHLRQTPLDAQPLASIERLGPEPGLLPLTDAVVRTFPDGLPTLFVGLHTALPTVGAPSIAPGDLRPVDEDWMVQADQETLGLALARAALAGYLDGGMIAAPDRPDLSFLHLDGTGFLARVRVWRFRSPPGTHDLEASGALRWDVDHLVVRLETLELDGKGEVAKKRLPWEIPLPPMNLPWPLERLETIDGFLVGGGRIPAAD